MVRPYQVWPRSEKNSTRESVNGVVSTDGQTDRRTISFQYTPLSTSLSGGIISSGLEPSQFTCPPGQSKIWQLRLFSKESPGLDLSRECNRWPQMSLDTYVSKSAAHQQFKPISGHLSLRSHRRKHLNHRVLKASVWQMCFECRTYGHMAGSLMFKSDLPLGPVKFFHNFNTVITVMSHERHGLWNYR